MARMAAAAGAMSPQMPRPSKMRRLALPSAVVRSSKLGCAPAPGATPSIMSTSRPVPPSASARLAPTIPPPTIAISTSRADAPAPEAVRSDVESPCIRASAVCHERFDLVHILRRPGCEHFDAAAGDHHVVFDAHTYAPKVLGHAAQPGCDVEARLNRHRHARLQDAPFV